MDAKQKLTEALELASTYAEDGAHATAHERLRSAVVDVLVHIPAPVEERVANALERMATELQALNGHMRTVTYHMGER